MSSPTLPITVTSRRVDDARRGRAGTARRRRRRRGRRPSRGGRAGSSAACVRGPAREAERAARSSRRVDVVDEVRDHGRDAIDALRAACARKRAALPGAVERLEERGVGERERVRRPVLRPRRARRPPARRSPRSARRSCGATHGRSALTTSTGPSSTPLERGGDRRALAAARIGDDLGAELLGERACGCVGGDDESSADRDARGEDVGEHRLRERRALASGGRAALAGRAAEGDDDGAIAERLPPWTTRASPSGSRPSRRCSTSPARATTPCARTGAPPS